MRDIKVPSPYRLYISLFCNVVSVLFICMVILLSKNGTSSGASSDCVLQFYPALFICCHHKLLNHFSN